MDRIYLPKYFEVSFACHLFARLITYSELWSTSVIRLLQDGPCLKNDVLRITSNITIRSPAQVVPGTRAALIGVNVFNFWFGHFLPATTFGSSPIKYIDGPLSCN